MSLEAAGNRKPLPPAIKRPERVGPARFRHRLNWSKSSLWTASTLCSDWPERIELHLVPVNDAARLTANRLRVLGDRPPVIVREQNLVPQTAGMQARQSEQVAQVDHYDPRTGTGAVLAVLRNGQRSAWWTLPRARIGRVLIRDEAVTDVAAMLRILVALDTTPPDQFAPAIGVELTRFVRIGQRHDLTSNSASMPVAGITDIRAEAEKSLPVRDLNRSTVAVAEELVKRVVARFRRR